MVDIEFFKSQAKKFYKDFQTQYLTSDGIYSYHPKYFNDIDEIILSYDIDEKSFTLMNAQHIIALLSGFTCWNDIHYASQSKLELGRLLLLNREGAPFFPIKSPILEEWEMYKNQLTLPNDLKNDDDVLLSIFKAVFLNIED